MTRKNTLALFLGLCLVLLIALLPPRREPVEGGAWKGELPLDTTTPTVTLMPEAGWWDQLPTPAGQPYSSTTPTP